MGNGCLETLSLFLILEGSLGKTTRGEFTCYKNKPSKKKNKMSMSITMAQVAKELGVSQVTVSAVINGREKRQRTSPKTVERIRAYLDECGYVHSKAALQIKKGHADDSIGILYCGDFARWFHLQKALSLLTNHIEQKYGIAEISGISAEKIKRGIQEQVAKGVKRLIWIHANTPKEEITNAQILFPFLNHMERVIIYNYDSQRDELANEYLKRGIDLVGFDRAETFRQVANFFRQNGHSRVALTDAVWSENRGNPGTNVLMEIFKEHGFDIYGLSNESGRYSERDEYVKTMTHRLIELNKKHQVQCAFIRNDLLAAEIMYYLAKEGVRVPEDIAIIGFGETPFTRLLPVPLTTFRHPIEAMCKRTIELLEKNKKQGQKYYFKSEFILNESHNQGATLMKKSLNN
jgi:DNA-binding LacI/PurR family transcriptional regulator